MASVMRALNETAISQLTRIIPNFYAYNYDFSGGNWNYIGDGGNDMFDSGNRVSYKIGSGDWTVMNYGQYYRHASEQVEVATKTGYPFAALMWIGNHGRSQDTFSLK